MDFKVLVVDYVTATFGCEDRYSDLLPEGFSMAYALTKLLNSYTRARMLTSPHLPLYTHGDESSIIHRVDCCDFEENILRIAEEYDMVVLVAPPMELVKLARILDGKLWGPDRNAIEILSNKYTAMTFLKKCGIAVPETIEVTSASDANLRLIDYPVVIKPCMLAGSECVYVARNSSEVERYVVEALRCDPLHRAVLQQYVDGVHGSISAILGGGKILFYSVNSQLIELEDNRFIYKGNTLPLRDYNIVENAYKVLEKFTLCYNSVKGYIGFDVVIRGGNPVVVEVNPRLTTPFIAIAKLYPEVGRLIISSMLGRNFSTYIYLGNVTSKTAAIVITRRRYETQHLIFNEFTFAYGERELKLTIYDNTK